MQAMGGELTCFYILEASSKICWNQHGNRLNSMSDLCEELFLKTLLESRGLIDDTARTHLPLITVEEDDNYSHVKRLAAPGCGNLAGGCPNTFSWIL